MDWISDPQAWIGFTTLTVLEIVLGIDTLIFISILASKLPRDLQGKARYLGLGLAMIMRIARLFSLSWIVRLTAPLFDVLGQEISGRDLVLLIGGLFLIGKATREIHERLEGAEGGESAKVAPSLRSVGLTGPYMHDGRFATLAEVVEFYDRGVQQGPALDPRLRQRGEPRRLNLAAEDRAALVAFLMTLNDTTLISDPRFSDPFRR